VAFVHLEGTGHCLDSGHGVAGPEDDFQSNQDGLQGRVNIDSAAEDWMGKGTGGIVGSCWGGHNAPLVFAGTHIAEMVEHWDL
jgi:hypothetical protein